MNRLHAVHWRRWKIDLATGVIGLALVGLPVVVAWVLTGPSSAALSAGGGILTRALARLYEVFCVGAAGLAAVRVWQSRRHRDHAHGLLENHTTVLDLRTSVSEPRTAPGLPTWLAALPGNEIFLPHVHSKKLELPRWQAPGGIKIAHLTDFHMSGRITHSYYSAIVDHVNAWEPDLIALTGDLVERPHCLDWIDTTLARLRAPSGVYFVLGNHDHRAGPAELRARLTDAGLVDLGGTWQEVSVDSTRLVLAGNELPWFEPAANLEAAPRHDDQGLPLRILLAHSPDQFAWAVARDVDLILAGHNHGGQVCFPLIGPVLAPSRDGTRYAAGLFRRGQTLLHVSRGTSSLAPFRWGCPPEIALLTLLPEPASRR